MMKSKKKLFIACGMLAIGLSTAYASMGGTTYTWLVGNGNWNVATKWSPNGVPDTAGEEALIDAAGTYTVTMNISPSIDTLTISNATATLNLAGNTLTTSGPNGINNSGRIVGPGTLVGTGINNGTGSIEVPSNTTLTMNAPSWTNNGAIIVNPTGVLGQTVLSIPQSMVLSGTGSIQLRRSDTTARVVTAGGATLTQSAGHTIQGRGRIAANLVNNGSVLANWSGDAIVLADQPMLNNATFTATGGGALNINGITVTQSGTGSIFADTTGQVNLIDANIVGGSLGSLPSTNVRSSGTSSISNLTFTGNLFVSQATALNASGTITNNGTINVNPDQVSNGCILTATANLLLQGTGTLQLSYPGTNANLASSGGAVITNAAGHTIQGRGQISGGLVNESSIFGNWSGGDLDFVGSPKINNNLIAAQNGGTVYVSGATLTQGVNGRIVADSGNVGHRNGSNVIGGKLQANGSFAHYVTAGTATLTSTTIDGPVLVSQATNLALGGATTVNNSTITVNYQGVSNQTKLRILEDHSLLGNGIVQMSKEGVAGEIQALNPLHVLTQGPSHTIQGRGLITTRFVNNGTILGNWNGIALVLQSPSFTNNSVIRAAGGGAIVVNNTQLLQSANGVIHPDSGNVAFQGASTISGGRILASANGNFVYIDNGTVNVNNLINDAEFRLTQGRSMSISGAIANNGLIKINPEGIGNLTTMNVIDNATVSGSGIMQFGRGGLQSHLAVATDKTLTFDGDHTAQGWGLISGQMINEAKIKGNHTGQNFQLSPSGTGMVNEGLVEASNGGGVVVTNGTLFENKGDFDIKVDGSASVSGVYKQSAGTTIVNGPLSGGNVQVTGGIVKGGNTILGSLNNAGGDVQPGNSAGKLRVQGVYTQGQAANLTIEIGGTTQITQYDLLEVTSSVTVDGKLTIKLINGFVPTPGQSFTVVTGSSVTGQFDEVVVEGSGEAEALVSYGLSQVFVTFLTKVNPTSVVTIDGIPFGGDVNSLFSSDDDWYSTLCDEENVNGKVEITTTSPVATLSNLRFAFETGATRSDLTERIEMFNYVSNTWVTVGPLISTNLGDRRRVVVQATNMSQFVQAGDRQMKVRVSWVPQTDLEISDGWGINIDQAAWFISE